MTYNLMTCQQNVTLKSGKSYRMRFDFRMLAEAENAYATQYGRRVGVPEFIGEIGVGSSVAVAVGAYAALVSGGLKLNWELFWNEIFTFANFDALRDGVEAGLAGMFPPPEVPTDDDEKN